MSLKSLCSTRSRTTHLVDLSLVHLLSDPLIALNTLRIRLPLSQESDLASLHPLASNRYGVFALN